MEMRMGKLSEAVLRRSVLKNIGHRREEVLSEPGQDCALLELEEQLAVSTNSVVLRPGTTSAELRAVCRTANNLAAVGAEPVGVMLHLLFPQGAQEALLKSVMQKLEAACQELNIEILGGHTEVNAAVTAPVLGVTGVGKLKKGQSFSMKQAAANEKLVVSKWVGLEGTAVLAEERADRLCENFSHSFVNDVERFREELSAVEAGKIGADFGVTAMHDLSEGGIFAALWELSAACGCGLEVDLKKIPIRQETVEVCELFGVNPYQIFSGGSLLMVTKDAEGLVRRLQDAGISAAVIGRLTDGADKILRNGTEVRYLDRPQMDELYRALGEEANGND